MPPKMVYEITSLVRRASRDIVKVVAEDERFEIVKRPATRRLFTFLDTCSNARDLSWSVCAEFIFFIAYKSNMEP
jgi:hypothetical protein